MLFTRGDVVATQKAAKAIERRNVRTLLAVRNVCLLDEATDCAKNRNILMYSQFYDLRKRNANAK